MAVLSPAADTVFRLSSRLHILPILHGSGDVAQEVRDVLISRPVDCLAVPLPPSFEQPLERAILELPIITVVVQTEPQQLDEPAANYVPVDPCQPVIMGIRVALGEGIARAYIDREVTVFEPLPFIAPDPFALKHVSLASFAAALTSDADSAGGRFSADESHHMDGISTSPTGDGI